MSLWSCDRGCNDYINYTHLEIEEWAKERYAYNGNETLVFYDIRDGDTSELTFTPHKNFDTTFSGYSYYDADNGEQCVGRHTDVDARIDHYYCKERDWYFRTWQQAETQEIGIEFWKRNNAESSYNFKTWLSTIYLDTAFLNRPGYRGCTYIGDTTYNNFKLHKTVRINSIFWEMLYDQQFGLLKWRFLERNHIMTLKDINL